MADRVPDESFIYCVILMPIDISGSGDSRPVDLGMLAQKLIRKPPGRFEDNLQRTNYRVNRLSVGAKSLKVEPRRKCVDRI
jgi:hypothetical protein